MIGDILIFERFVRLTTGDIRFMGDIRFEPLELRFELFCMQRPVFLDLFCVLEHFFLHRFVLGLRTSLGPQGFIFPPSRPKVVGCSEIDVSIYLYR